MPQLNSTGTDAYQCKFNPENATYRNFIDANVGPNNGVMPAAGVTFAGPIFWRGGRLYGNAIVTGPITNNATTMYCQGGMKLRGGVTSVKNGGNLQADGGNLYIESDVEKINGVQAIGHTIFFGKENALAESLYIYFGVSYRHFGKVDLQGWNQRCGRIIATTDLANEAATYVTSADPATLSILNQSDNVTWYGNLNGKASTSASRRTPCTRDSRSSSRRARARSSFRRTRPAATSPSPPSTRAACPWRSRTPARSTSAPVRSWKWTPPPSTTSTWSRAPTRRTTARRLASTSPATARCASSTARP